MSARSEMIHRAVIERPNTPGVDPWGGDTAPVWGKIANAPCAFRISARKEAVSERQIVVIEQAEMLVPLTLDIVETDRVNGIRDRLGLLISDRIYNIRGVFPRRTYKLCMLETANG